MTSLGIVRLIKILLLMISAVLVIVMSIKTVDGQVFARAKIKTKDFLNGRLKNSKLSYFNENRLLLYLSKSGVNFMFENVTPLSYMAVKFICSLLGLLLGLELLNVFFAIIFMVAGFFAPDALVKFSNNQDNEEMMPDIKRVYDTIRIQTKAGVYITHSLAECYLVIKNKRLKEAFLDLNNKIIANKDIESAINDLNFKFNNKHIDTLCIVIKQSLESGKSVKALEDLTNQMNDIQHAINLKEKDRLELSIQVLELLVFVGVIAICLYSMAMELTGSMTVF